MRNPYQGLLETGHVKLVARHARRRGFRGQDLDEVIQLTAIRLCRTDVRDEAMIIEATNESIADVCRREERHQGRLERLEQLARPDRVDSAVEATSQAIDVHECVEELPDRDRSICEQLARGRSMREIADSLGLSKNAICQRINRLRRHFSKCGLNGTAV